MTDKPDLAAWLLEQIAEDERVARAAEHNPRLDLIVSARRFGKSSAAEHINTWMPSRVLAECDAKRAMLDLILTELGPDRSWKRKTLKEAWDYKGPWVQALKTLGSSYADRPGYREEWKPVAARHAG